MQFVTAATLVAMLAKGHDDGLLEKQLTQLSRPKLLIIDELGYLPFEANAAHLFFQRISRRYEKGSILITSNRSVGEWGRERWSGIFDQFAASLSSGMGFMSGGGFQVQGGGIIGLSWRQQPMR